MIFLKKKRQLDRMAKDDLYSLKRQLLKEKRKLRAKILGVDEVDGNTGQRQYNEGTKTKRALKIEMFGSKSKASNYGDETSIEKKVKEILEKKNIEFVEQKAIRYINVDFYLPQYDAAVQCEGSYWHADIRFYPTPKNNIQRKNIEKDKISTQVILDQKIHLLKLWQYDIEERLELVEKKLDEFLEKIKTSRERNLEGTCMLRYETSQDW